LAYEEKDGFGSLFINDKKGIDRAPDRRGTVKFGGVVYELAGWLKETAKGDKFLSLSIKPKEEYVKPQAPRSNFEETGSDIPF